MAQEQQGPAAEMRALLLDADALVRATARGRVAGRSPQWRRVDLRPVELKVGPRLQVTRYSQTQAFTANHEWAEAAPVVDALLQEGFADWTVETRTQRARMRVGAGGRATVNVRPREDAVEQPLAHDRVKPHPLPLGHPVLHGLGLTTAAGTVKPSRQAKLRQVEEFLRVLDASVEPAVGDRPLRMLDLGCGNAYLTFAAHALLSERRGGARVVGVDVKEQARQRNSALAAQLGVARDVEFVRATIDAAPLEVAGEPPDVVLALHACDTATDDAIAAGVRSGARLLLVAPCCHHDLQRQISAHTAPFPYAAITRHGILGERWGDLLTDALRASLLRLLGYRVDVMEFVDSTHTPRNVLLRAVRTGAAAEAELGAEFDALVSQWGVVPRLGTLLESELRRARGGEVGR